jgi:hypothetical protein
VKPEVVGVRKLSETLVVGLPELIETAALNAGGIRIAR